MKSIFSAPRARIRSATFSGVLLALPALPARGEVSVIPRTFEGTGLLSLEIDPVGNASTHFYGDGSLRAVELPEGLARSFLSSQAAALPLAGVATSPENPETALISGTSAAGAVSEQGGGSTRADSYVLGGDAQLAELIQGTILTTLLRDANGLVTRLVLPSGHRWDMSYDGRGNLTSLRDVTIGGTTQLSYDPVHSLPSTILFPGGAALRMEYDALGNPAVRLTPEGRRQSAEWNVAGQISRAIGQNGLVTAFTYDAAGNIETLRQGEAASERLFRLTRDAGGRVLRVEAPEGRTFSYSYHPSGGIRSVTSFDGSSTDLEENANGDVVALVRPGEAPARHMWVYDGLRRIAAYTPPGQASIIYGYNVHSEPTSLGVEDEDLVSFEYNGRGQVSFHSEKAAGLEPLTTTRLYDDARTGRLTWADSSDGIRMTPAYSGEFTSRLIWAGAAAGSFRIAFDQRYRITSNQVGDGPTIAYTYDNDNLLLSAGDLTITRDPVAGVVTAMALGSVKESFAYNAFGELVSQTASANGVEVFSAVQRRDNLGRVTETLETVNGVTVAISFAYDVEGRIATVRRNGVVTEQYAYDVRGNLIADHLNGTYTYNAADQLLTAGGATFTYMPTGERLTRTRGGVTSVFHYTALSTLRGINLGDGRDIGYRHDAARNRAVRVLNGTVQQAWLCPGFNRPVAALNAAGQITSRYVHGLSEDTPDYILQDGNTYRLVTDQIGSVRLVINAATGVIVQQLSYDAYGKTLSDSAPGFQPFGFAGGWTDPDTSLIRFGARDYDPDVRRWTTPDPISFASGGLNLHAYVQGDPVNRIDRSGLNDAVNQTREQIARIYYNEGQIKPSDLIIIRNGHVLAAKKDSPLYVGDQVRTGPNTAAGIELLLGGRINVPKGRSIVLVNEGQGQLLNPETGATSKIVLNSGGAWAKFQKQDKPLTIQTRGGVLGIGG